MRYFLITFAVRDSVMPLPHTVVVQTEDVAHWLWSRADEGKPPVTVLWSEEVYEAIYIRLKKIYTE
jgi:hypothetical protein